MNFLIDGGNTVVARSWVALQMSVVRLALAAQPKS